MVPSRFKTTKDTKSTKGAMGGGCRKCHAGNMVRAWKASASRRAAENAEETDTGGTASWALLPGLASALKAFDHGGVGGQWGPWFSPKTFANELSTQRAGLTAGVEVITPRSAPPRLCARPAPSRRRGTLSAPPETPTLPPLILRALRALRGFALRTSTKTGGRP